MGRHIGLDLHRNFAQVAVVEDGVCSDEGRIGVTPEALREWAETLTSDDEVALEATGNSDAVAMLLTPLVRRVVVANSRKVRAIAEAKVKTDKVDARILAQLLAADFLAAAWLPDDRIRILRRQVARRTHLVRQRTRLKNQVHAILARNLAQTCPVTDLFGKTGRRWLGDQDLPPDKKRSVEALGRQLDFHGEELKLVERELAVEAQDDPTMARLITIPGVDAIVAISILAAVGDFSWRPELASNVDMRRRRSGRWLWLAAHEEILSTIGTFTMLLASLTNVSSLFFGKRPPSTFALWVVDVETTHVPVVSRAPESSRVLCTLRYVGEASWPSPILA